MIVAEAFERVVGVDTHAHTHTFCIIDSRTGAVIAGALRGTRLVVQSLCDLGLVGRGPL
jgi:hypothetical protein